MTRRARLLRLLLLTLRALAMAAGATVVLAWLVGRVASDRSVHTQWLLWIPTPALAGAVALGLLGALGPGRTPLRRRWSVWGWVATGVLLAAHFALVEHRLLRAPPTPAAGLEIVHWNMSFGHVPYDDEESARTLLGLLGDVTILEGALGLYDLYPTLPPEIAVVGVGWATILSRVPVLEARQIVGSANGRVILLRLDTRASLGRPIVAYVVTLPSDPALGRALVARRVRGLLESADEDPPDLVVGDFNIPRGSASIATMFPGFRHAYAEGGHGYAASYHRRFPLYHIDHVLLGDTLACARYDLIDPGKGRHYVQRAVVRTRDDGAGARLSRAGGG